MVTEAASFIVICYALPLQGTHTLLARPSRSMNFFATFWNHRQFCWFSEEILKVILKFALFASFKAKCTQKDWKHKQNMPFTSLLFYKVQLRFAPTLLTVLFIYCCTLLDILMRKGHHTFLLDSNYRKKSNCLQKSGIFMYLYLTPPSEGMRKPSDVTFVPRRSALIALNGASPLGSHENHFF